MISDCETFPRIKPIYPIYRLSSETFRIGAQLGVTAEFEDPDGQVWALVSFLDGSRNLQQICDEMRSLFPKLTDRDVDQAILALDSEGFVEDSTIRAEINALPVAERYIGNVNYFSHFNGLNGNRELPQQKLQQSKVVLFGLGGAGSNILAILAATGVGHIVAVDYRSR